MQIKAEYQKQLLQGVSERRNTHTHDKRPDPDHQSSPLSSAGHLVSNAESTVTANNINPRENCSCSCNLVSYKSAFYFTFGISLFLVIALLLLPMYSNLIVLQWALNADMKRIEKVHPSTAFDERTMYIEDKQQLEEQLLMTQRQILQLNREVLDLKRPRNHRCTGANELKIMCKKEFNRLIEESKDYVARIENLTQQRNLLLNGCPGVQITY